MFFDLIKKWAEDLLFQRRQRNTPQTYEKMLQVTNHQGDVTQNHHEIPHLLGQRLPKSGRERVGVRMYRKGNFCALPVQMEIAAAATDNSMEVHPRIKRRITI